MILETALSYIVWDFDPIIYTFNIFGYKLPITWYGLMFAMAFLVGQQVFGYIFKTEGKPSSDLDSLTVYMVLGTVIGARVGHYVFYEWELLFSDPFRWFVSMIIPPFAGLASHGASIAIPIALYLYSRKKPDQPFFWILDRMAIVVSFAGLIRLGNFLNSEIYGLPTSLPWGVKFMNETDSRLLPVVPRHPTQMYEFLFCMLLFVITFLMWKYRRHLLPNGVIFCTFMILLFTFRFFVEFVKNNQSAFENDLSLNMGQLLSIPLVLGNIALMVYCFKRKPDMVAERG